ncbi:BMP family ABC transporter substrate-binding protein [Bacillus sp. FJAT-49736]|uniref:BMP family lipoprotein n=1 Tax=Bacillus sp. FJAT-49736 TaxID=2833582 RepID=UPI001BC99983|nr:BMP family ABC transporter substrate-binding protein [Bacillus sp. FJAT-49736]MBS4174961.1 BMP family ABC transporter substrate-binding protein [Bacillus sp. FJAT-49736]
MKIKQLTSFLIIICLLAGCAAPQKSEKQAKKIKIGIMLSDVGLGDQSFSDAAFNGLSKARDELGILFDYRELKDSKTYENGIEQLVKEGNDVVIGLGFAVQADLEKVAKKYPKQKFILVDSVSTLPNVTSITFREDQGSFLAGALAALTSKSNKLGFIGGDDVELIHKFENGFKQGARFINPKIKVESVYAGDFGNDKLGAEIARKMIHNGTDVLYAAAGFTGVGVLRTAEEYDKYAIGVDSDQYFYAEKAVISSMQKNIDIALYQVAKNLVDHKGLQKGQIQLGLKENGIGLAPIRVIHLSDKDQQTLDSLKEKLSSEEIKTIINK